MTLNTFTSGINTSFSSQLNSNFKHVAELNARTLIVGMINGDLSTTNQYAIIDTSLTVSDINSSSEWTYDELNNGFYGDIVVDQINDSSLDTSIWSNTGTGSVSEDTSKIRITATNNTNHTLAADQASAPDFKTFSGDSKVLILQRRENSSGNFTSTWRVYIGSTQIYQWQVLSTAVGSNESLILFINKSAETATLYTKGGSALATDIDISSEANWTVEFYAQSTSGGGTGTVYYDIYSLSYITEGSATTPVLITASDTLSITATTVFTHLGLINDTLISAYELSLNGGTNFTDIESNDSFVKIGTSGSSAVLRLTATIPSSLANDSSYEATYISNYGILYK